MACLQVLRLCVLSFSALIEADGHRILLDTRIESPV
jgi:metal-dependent hydrolase (beta-lactamase superfamily II)